MTDLIINGRDALITWGVRMGEGFIDEIDGFPTMKPYVENQSGLEHGKRIITFNPKVASRQINLPFTLSGNTMEDYQQKKQAFINELIRGSVIISVPPIGSSVYKLVYLGKGMVYAQNRDKTFAKITLKFEEPNPMDRG